MSTIISFCNWLQIFILGNQKQKQIKKKSIPEPRYSYIGFEGKEDTIMEDTNNHIGTYVS